MRLQHYDGHIHQTGVYAVKVCLRIIDELTFISKLKLMHCENRRIMYEFSQKVEFCSL